MIKACQVSNVVVTWLAFSAAETAATAETTSKVAASQDAATPKEALKTTSNDYLCEVKLNHGFT